MGRDAIAIRQAKITPPKRHLLNAYEILVTRCDQFRTEGGSLSANISQGRGVASTSVGDTKLE